MYPDRSAVRIVGGPSLTYAQLRQRVEKVAGALARLGVGKGDRVAVMAPAGLAFFDAYLGAARLGAAAVPFSTRLAPAEIARQMTDTDPRAAIVGADYADKIAQAFSLHPRVAEVAVIGLPDDQWGEAVTAVVVPLPGSSPTLAGIADWVGARLAVHMKPKRLILAERLPRGPTGKVQNTCSWRCTSTTHPHSDRHRSRKSTGLHRYSPTVEALAARRAVRRGSDPELLPHVAGAVYVDRGAG